MREYERECLANERLRYDPVIMIKNKNKKINKNKKNRVRRGERNK